jgi:2-oxoglutarate/2-oxoacid ferredoxin oxidoreductase subunit beta
MAPITTGAYLANDKLIYVGISGDGDTASIGLGNFLHMIRRNVPMVYIIENNGVYGLTKGQFSATADKGSLNKGGTVNDSDPIDCCALAIKMGCQFVARSFSGDFKQVTPLLKAALSHRGAALIDIISPCITFNNHEGSTKSLSYAKSHEEPLHEIGFVPFYEQIQTDYAPGEMQRVVMHDGSFLTLKKLDHDYDPSDKSQAIQLLDKAGTENLFLTGLLYHGSDGKSFGEALNLVDEPLATLPESKIRPPAEALTKIMETLK